MEGMELICFQLITAAGAAKSNYIEAIQKAKEGLYDEAEQLIADGDAAIGEGHQAHTDLIQKEASGDEGVKMSLLLTHAEDQMMSTEVFKVVAEEVIELYKRINA